MFCKVCGEKIEDNTTYCPKCGTKIEDSATAFVSTSSTPAVKRSYNTIPKALKTICQIGMIAGIVGVAIFAVIVLVGLFVWGKVYLYNGYDITKVFTTISIILMVIGLLGIVTKYILNSVYKVDSYYLPSSKKVLTIVLLVACVGFSTWGVLNGINESSSTKTDSMLDVYIECGCASPWADWGVDYIKIDTNPYDYDSDYSAATKYMNVALTAIVQINNRLGLPSYLYEQMMSTSALDGRQYYYGEKVTVSWHYHPDKGLEVMYTTK